MKLKGPIVTLMGGLVVAGVLFALSVAAAETNKPSKTNAAGNAAAAPGASTSPAADPQANAATSTPPAEPAAPPITFAGKVTGGGATLAIAVKEGKAIAYLCNGKTLESWMQGDAANGQMNLVGTQQGTLTATFDTTAATGTVSAAGKTYTFQIKPAAAPSGLYRLATKVNNAQVVGGWIVYDGETVGMVSRTDNGSTSADSAPAIDTATGNVTIDGTTYQAGKVDGKTPIG